MGAKPCHRSWSRKRGPIDPQINAQSSRRQARIPGGGRHNTSNPPPVPPTGKLLGKTNDSGVQKNLGLRGKSAVRSFNKTSEPELFLISMTQPQKIEAGV